MSAGSKKNLLPEAVAQENGKAFERAREWVDDFENITEYERVLLAGLHNSKLTHPNTNNDGPPLFRENVRVITNQSAIE